MPCLLLVRLPGGRHLLLHRWLHLLLFLLHHRDVHRRYWPRRGLFRRAVAPLCQSFYALFFLPCPFLPVNLLLYVLVAGYVGLFDDLSRGLDLQIIGDRRLDRFLSNFDVFRVYLWGEGALGSFFFEFGVFFGLVSFLPLWLALGIEPRHGILASFYSVRPLDLLIQLWRESALRHLPLIFSFFRMIFPCFFIIICKPVNYFGGLFFGCFDLAVLVKVIVSFLFCDFGAVFGGEDL